VGSAPLEFLGELVALRTISADPNRRPVLAYTANLLAKTLSDMGFSALCEEGYGPAPIVWASRGPMGAKNSLIIYGHYDVQPEGPRADWHSDPFQLVELDGLLYGRGVADDKGPIVALLAAIGNVRNWENLRLTVLLEGGEEVGSPEFGDFLRAHRDELASHLAVLSADCGCPDENTPTIITCLRGIITGELTLRTAHRDIHSGYGGCVPNAVQELALLCSKFHREDGSVAIPHFYDGIQKQIDREELAAVRSLAEREELADILGVGCLRDIFSPVPPRAVHGFFPSLEWNGIWGGHTGEGSKTIIPAAAYAKFSLRTVPGQSARVLCAALEDFAQRNCPPYGTVELHCAIHGPAYAIGGPSEAPELHRLLVLLENSLAQEFGHLPLRLREGGSIGAVSDFKEILGLNSLLLGVVPTASHIHAPDENWPIQSFHKTRCALSAFFNGLAR
jgi:acetylornithine deacetylase/succinyl-diaminopimelate desuccinylase-like protein